MKIRPTAILIEDKKILLIEQDVGPKRKYSLPGGTLEEGETIHNCLKREIREETGLEIEPIRLLYICDRITPRMHILHITFEVKLVGGRLNEQGTSRDTKPIHSVKLVPIEELQNYGFSERFCQLAKKNFPNAGTYQGEIKNIGL